MTWVEAFRDLLSRGPTEVLLASTATGVVVPDSIRRADKITCLQYGNQLPLPVVDLNIDEMGIGATLSFGRVPSRTFVPWTAVFMIKLADDSLGYAPLPIGPGGALVIHPIDPGRMILIEGGPPPAAAAPAPPDGPAPARHLGSVPMTEAPDEDTEEIPTGSRPNLRLVN